MNALVHRSIIQEGFFPVNINGKKVDYFGSTQNLALTNLSQGIILGDRNSKGAVGNFPTALSLFSKEIASAVLIKLQ